MIYYKLNFDNQCKSCELDSVTYLQINTSSLFAHNSFCAYLEFIELDLLQTRLNKLSQKKESHRLDIEQESYGINDLTLPW